MRVRGAFSNSQIDKLGERLRAELREGDLRLLDEYRRTFGGAYDAVVGTIRDALSVEVSGRPAKSTISIIEKLQRESIRLSQVQDIAGCRIVVEDIAEQDSLVKALTDALPGSFVTDRRMTPSHGYRAVHVIANADQKPVEIQIRTSVQHLWAEMSEKFSDVFDHSIKYGGGGGPVREILNRLALQVARIETLEPIAGPAILSTRSELASIMRDTLEMIKEVKRKHE